MKRDFIHITDFTTQEVYDTLDLAADLKEKVKKGVEYHPLKNKTMAMIFAKPSARTRISFETGMTQLGGHAIYLSPNDIGIGKREAVKDIARVISRYDDLIMARLFEHQHMLELAEYSKVPVINGLTDFNHPCQIIADILTVKEHLGKIENLKIVFVGDGNNMVHSWLALAQRIPMHFVLAAPKGYDPSMKVVQDTIDAGLSKVEILRDPKEAVKGAHVIYTDVWTSMGQEEEYQKRLKDFNGFQVNAELMNCAPDDVLLLHCLPAHRDEEITDEVLEGKNSVVFDEAENRLHAQKAIMLKVMGF